jgi:hypothetical protein
MEFITICERVAIMNQTTPAQSCQAVRWVFHIDKDDWLAKDRNETWQEVSPFRASMRSSRPQGEDLPLVLDTRYGPDWRGY